MGKGWMNALKSYFQKLNQLQIDGDVMELAAFFQARESSQQEQERIHRGRENFAYRKAKPLKSRTVIKHIQILSEEKEKVSLILHNYLWKLYQIDSYFMEQEDEQYHQMTLREQNGNWLIEDDSIIAIEGSELFRRPENEQQEDLPVTMNQELLGQHPPGYNRAKVKRYAELWWNRYNPVYPKFDVDCTNFVSQCIHAGGLPLEPTGNRSKGWWVQGKSNWSYSWSVAHSLMNYLLGAGTKQGKRAVLKKSADELWIGDVICYDWDGNGGFQHNTVVVAKDPNGMPLVNAHTTNSRHRYWDYRDSYAWTEKTNYKFIHIVST